MSIPAPISAARWNAATPASSTAVVTSARSRGAESPGVDRAERAVARHGHRLLGGGRQRVAGHLGVEPVGVEAGERGADRGGGEQAGTRAIALLTAEAIPASDSSASASTVAVRGATVIARPSE